MRCPFRSISQMRIHLATDLAVLPAIAMVRSAVGVTRLLETFEAAGPSAARFFRSAVNLRSSWLDRV